MLKILSFRNAKRQVRDYLLFLITMIGAVALIYSFNSLIFSDAITGLMGAASTSSRTYLTIMIVFFSLIIVCILGWFVRYMINFILLKRSQELSTYMILGFEKTEITKMFFMENSVIGMTAFVMGLVSGFLFAEILNAMLTSPFGETYSLASGFSLQAVGLSLLYFCLIYLYALISCRRKLKKMQLIELLHYQKYNEEPHITKSATGIIIFCVSILLGMGGIFLFLQKPFGNPMDGYELDFFLGLILATICLYGVFYGLLPVLHRMLGNNQRWKYKKSNMLLYRLLTSKINNITNLLSRLAVVFGLAILIFGMALSLTITINKSLDMDVFDIQILYREEERDFSQYEEYLMESTGITSNYSYTLYTDYGKDFMKIRNDFLSVYLKEIERYLQPDNYTYSENQYDTYMKFSDYCVLREILGLKQIAMEENEFFIHCMPYLKESFTEYTSVNQESNPYQLSCAGIYTEDFSQYEGYGNGQEYILIVPDEVTDQMNIIYSLFVANCNSHLSSESLSLMQSHFDNLVIVNNSLLVGSSSTGDDGFASKLTSGGADYLSGKAVGASYGEKMIIILPLFYLALMLCMIGVVILAVQFFGENRKYISHYKMLNIMGLDSASINKTARKQVLFYFSIPVIPTILLGGSLAFASSYSMLTDSFHVPVFFSVGAVSLLVAVATVVLFMTIYFIYGFISYITFKRDINKNMI